MRTPQWVKKLGGHAGELYVAAELSKRGIPNALLPENFSGDDLIIGGRNGKALGYVQVKSCHPDRADTFLLKEEHEKWVSAKDNEFVVFVWLGSAKKNESPVYWIARRKDVGYACVNLRPSNKNIKERRFAPDEESGLNRKWKYPTRLEKKWRNDWAIFRSYMP
ncbi:MAG: hypothetical protein QXJ74_10315 [Nitrososphaera sp.]|uniref:hypothetical protein n=1 Tax=Nitrososphaera sp. TaxID=1971748 RepID=UPI0017E196BE|nr:hypothetical protein [Nitrososphaera sp.]NWG37249.1 hypothetical protein [Nitrososphaera sp.]